MGLLNFFRSPAQIPTVPAPAAWREDSRALARASFRYGLDDRSPGHQFAKGLLAALKVNDGQAVGQLVGYLVGFMGVQPGPESDGPERFVAYIEALRDGLKVHFESLMGSDEEGTFRRFFREGTGDERKWLTALSTADRAMRTSAQRTKR
jgi:hypothetical protein